MEKKTFLVPNISCGHCVMTIKNELGDMEGVLNVEGNPETKLITVEWDAPATLDEIKETLKEINYPVADQ
ncbi:MAG: heavy-metal-associated domain-containing protein [Deltaproteobacteria bacterium]|nr:heavy-metal-associated domain-containing protein [Deltaproteobacteria bacterium]